MVAKKIENKIVDMIKELIEALNKVSNDKDKTSSLICWCIPILFKTVFRHIELVIKKTPVQNHPADASLLTKRHILILLNKELCKIESIDVFKKLSRSDPYINISKDSEIVRLGKILNTEE